MFLQVSVCPQGGACVVAGGRVVAGGHAWLLGACMVARGHAWLLGACVVARGCAWLPGACLVARGHAWLPGRHAWQRGGMHGKGGCAWWRGACVVKGGLHGKGGAMHRIGRDTEMRSMSGRYASYWNAFSLFICWCVSYMCLLFKHISLSLSVLTIPCFYGTSRTFQAFQVQFVYGCGLKLPLG